MKRDMISQKSVKNKQKGSESRCRKPAGKLLRYPMRGDGHLRPGDGSGGGEKCYSFTARFLFDYLVGNSMNLSSTVFLYFF